MDKQRGRPVLVEFWDFCRVNSLRTLPYLKAWHERYAERRPARDRHPHRRLPPARATPRHAVAAVERLGIEYPVVIDERLELWDFYGNEGWPARYLWDQQRRAVLAALRRGRLRRRPSARSRRCSASSASSLARRCAPRTRRACCCPAQTEDQPGAYSGPYEAGGVWAVLEGAGEVTAGGRAIAVDGPGCFPLVEHPHHTAGVLELAVGDGVTCHATCFTPGVAAPGGPARPAAG